MKNDWVSVPEDLIDKYKDYDLDWDAIQKNDEEEIEKAFYKHCRIIAWAFKYFKHRYPISEDDLRDLCYERYFIALQSYDPDGAPFLSYFKRCVHNEAITETKKQDKIKRSETHLEDLASKIDNYDTPNWEEFFTGDQSPYSTSDARLYIEDLKRHWQQVLSDGQYEVVKEYMERGHQNQEDIAEKLGVSQPYVAQVLMVIREKTWSSYKESLAT